jgi:hypothetical protein
MTQRCYFRKMVWIAKGTSLKDRGLCGRSPKSPLILIEKKQIYAYCDIIYVKKFCDNYTFTDLEGRKHVAAVRYCLDSLL